MLILDEVKVQNGVSSPTPPPPPHTHTDSLSLTVSIVLPQVLAAYMHTLSFIRFVGTPKPTGL